MRNRLKYRIRHFFTLHKSEQRGWVVLLILLVILLLFQWLYPLVFPLQRAEFAPYNREVEAFVRAKKALEDSLHLVRLQKSGKLTVEQARRLLHPFPFDPNRMTEKQGLQMGLSAKQTKTILHYLARGGRFRKKEDLKKMHGLSEAEYAVLAPFVRISPTGKEETHRTATKTTRHKTELNSADTARLIHNLKLPAWLAERVVKYRRLLGGFYSTAQLLEVYGMKRSAYNLIKGYLFVDTSKIKRIDLNRATFKQLLHHPYFNYETTKKLVQARDRVHGFSTFWQVKTETRLPDTLLNKIRHYLYIRPLKN